MKLSVIIPTYNRGQLLLRAVNSVIIQRYELQSMSVDLEIVVIDDNPAGSLDDIIKSIEVLDESDIYVYKNIAQHGAGNARNFGVSKATGDYITFLDDDDFYLPGRLYENLNKLFEGQYSFVSSGRISESGNLSNINVVPNQVFGEIGLDSVKFGNHIDIGIVLKRDLFLEVGGFDPNFKAYEDWDLIIRLLQKLPGFKCDSYNYVVNDEVGRVRVSSNETLYTHFLAKKYHQYFGDRWYYRLVSSSLRFQGKLTLVTAVEYSLKSKSINPFIIYIKKFLRN